MVVLITDSEREKGKRKREKVLLPDTYHWPSWYAFDWVHVQDWQEEQRDSTSGSMSIIVERYRSRILIKYDQNQ